MLGVAGAGAGAVIPCAPLLHRATARSHRCFIPTGTLNKPDPTPFLLSKHGNRGGLSARASRRPRAPSGDDDDVGRNEDYDDGEEEEEEEEEELVPFEEMRRWLENKPRGFGEGKVYDTSVEERLLEEMERSREAQLANLSKINAEPKNASRAKKQEPQKNEIDVPTGICVRVSNLPRKKNIHRDLQLAFKGFLGIRNISPAVTGNQKTRDPVCRGFAFLDLESEEVAKRFIQTYSKQNVAFGKVQKQITCTIMNASSLSNSIEQSSDGAVTVTQQFIHMGDKMVTSSDVDDLSWNPRERNFLDDSISSLVDGDFEGETRSQQLNNSLLKDAENGTLRNEENSDSDGSLDSWQKQKQKPSGKKAIKTKSEKSSKLSMPASLVRLKVRERAVLTGVLSKYGGQASS